MSEDRPRWAAALDTIKATIIALALIVVGALLLLLRPGIDPGIALALVFAGATGTQVTPRLRRGRSPAPATSARSDRGSASLWLLVVVALIGAVVFVTGATGCTSWGATRVQARDEAHYSIRRGPPCVIDSFADRELVHTLRAPKRCRVTVDGKELP